MTAIDLEIPALADAEEISAVAQASFRAAFADVSYPPADLAHFLDSAMGSTAYARQMADSRYALRIARNHGGAMTGLIKTGPNDLPMPAGQPPVELTRELHQLYLLDEAKGRGIADAMMAWAEADAQERGAVALYLSVYIDNSRAQRFYARHGYREIGKNPFRVGTVIDDDRVWKKPL